MRLIELSVSICYMSYACKVGIEIQGEKHLFLKSEIVKKSDEQVVCGQTSTNIITNHFSFNGSPCWRCPTSLVSPSINIGEVRSDQRTVQNTKFTYEGDKQSMT